MPLRPGSTDGLRTVRLMARSMLVAACLFAWPAASIAAPGKTGEAENAKPRAEPLPPPQRKAKPQKRTPNADEERDEPHGPSGCPDRGQPLELIV